jgi:hypothetical protein
VLGGILIADEVIDVTIPVLFFWLRKRRWRRLAREQVTDLPHTLDEKGRPAHVLGA